MSLPLGRLKDGKVVGVGGRSSGLTSELFQGHFSSYFEILKIRSRSKHISTIIISYVRK